VTDGISIRGITKRFRSVQALAGIDLDVARGEIVALLGPNGAGKSTLMRILATTVRPDGGSARVGGHDVVTQSAAARRSFGLALGDERSWYWRLSGRQNLEFFAALYGLPRRSAAAVIAELLAEVGLAEAADRRFDGYSTGMRTRLSLARALLPDPPVLLLDEPSRSLDPVAAAAFRQRVVALGRDRRMAILYATHDLHEAAAIASRVVVLAAGRVAARLPGGTSPAELEQALLAAAGR
jgi:ABC-2 type transport system ATP-binding protein